MTRYAVIAATLAAAALVTHFLGDRAVRSTRDNLAGYQSEQLEEAIDWISGDFKARQDDLLRRAQAVVSDADARFLVESDFSGQEPTSEVEAALKRFEKRYAADGPITVELYAQSLTLRAWTGPSLLPRPEPDQVMPDSAVRVVEDAFRKALVLWMPVGMQGAVRIARAVESSEIERLTSGYQNLADTWRATTGLQLDVTFGPTPVVVDESRFVTVPLKNASSEVLATVVISRSSGQGLIRSIESRYADVEAFWWTLLLFWIAAWLWVWMGETLPDFSSGLKGLAAAPVARVATLVGLRYGLLFFDVPGRWLHDGPARALFDPVHLASEVGGGVARSVGDLAITSLFLLAAALAVFQIVSRYRAGGRNPSAAAIAVAGFGTVVMLSCMVLAHAELTRQSMLDATLDFFAWTGLAPEPLVLVVFCSLLLATIAILIGGTAVLIGYIRWAQLDRNDQSSAATQTVLAALAGSAVIGALALSLLGLDDLVPSWTLILFLGVMIWPAWVFVRRKPPLIRALRIRSILLTILVAAVLLYPLLYRGMDEQRRLRLLDVAEDFSARGDAEARAAVESVLEQIHEAPQTEIILSQTAPLFPDDGMLEQLAYDFPMVDLIPGVQLVTVAFYTPDLSPLASFQQDRRHAFEPTPSMPVPPAGLLGPDLPDFLYQIRTIEDPRSGETEGYTAIATVWLPDHARPAWVVMRVQRREVESPFGSLFGYTDWRRSLSLAEFRNGRRIRSEGEDFERYVLPPEIEASLQESSEVWQDEEIYGRAYVTYYRRTDSSPVADGESGTVVAVRAPAIIPYDHLYYLLRIALAGLWLAIPAYLIGLVIRGRMGLIPSRRRQYGDRVLDAFLIVGTIAVAVMGLVGQQVITRENEGAIRSRLERRLQRMEDALARAADPDETLYDVQRRIPIDSLSDQLGLDLAVYDGPWLSRTSASLAEAGALMGYRLPGEAYDQLFVLRFRQAFIESSDQFGETHTIGYQALSDEAGFPQSVVAVLTFPEQARIREERARTTAYFFGALLLLLLIIMTTATTLARALTGPLRRLRDGMQSVAAGRVQRPIPVESRDEVGQLVETFNVMQSQLSESRRKLAQQERELAWTEMARQVAHEIKNPLTPMKLSIQHLQRAYEEFDPSDPALRERFANAFKRITQTVSEQIETLAEIANEFSTFARLPRRHIETVDPNRIIREAVELTGTEIESGIKFQETAEPVFVQADPDELRRVFINLLKNAVHSVDGEGTVEVVARITAGLDESPSTRAVLCEVIDTGAGIEPEVQTRIFHPNFSTKTSGMGLGLAIAKRSVEAMNGQIGFTTEVGHGTTFWVKLPLVDT